MFRGLKILPTELHLILIRVSYGEEGNLYQQFNRERIRENYLRLENTIKSQVFMVLKPKLEGSMIVLGLGMSKYNQIQELLKSNLGI